VLRKAATPAKRSARLDGRLSSDGGSARRREQAAGIQTAGSRGSVQPQLDGWVHSTVMGVMVLTRRRWRGAATKWVQSRAEVAEPGRRRRLEQLRLLGGAVRGFAGRRQGPRTGAPSDGLAFRTARQHGAPAARAASGSSTGGLRCSSPTTSPSPSPYPPSPLHLRWTGENFPNGGGGTGRGRLGDFYSAARLGFLAFSIY
jgi:hypothetical protein